MNYQEIKNHRRGEEYMVYFRRNRGSQNETLPFSVWLKRNPIKKSPKGKCSIIGSIGSDLAMNDVFGRLGMERLSNFFEHGSPLNDTAFAIALSPLIEILNSFVEGDVELRKFLLQHRMFDESQLDLSIYYLNRYLRKTRKSPEAHFLTQWVHEISARAEKRWNDAPDQELQWSTLGGDVKSELIAKEAILTQLEMDRRPEY